MATAKGGGMIIYGLKTCDTCRKARNALTGADFVDLRADGLPDAVLDTALARFGAKLVNTRSTTWRGLSAAERQRPPHALIRDYPAVMKRPLVVDGGRMVLGWDKAAQAALGL
jgi:arsenate reductase